MVITLRSYLERLKEAEASRPEALRRRVPEIAELATEIGVAHSTIHRLANNEMASINLRLGGLIIKAMRARGFETDVADLIKYIERDGDE